MSKTKAELEQAPRHPGDRYDHPVGVRQITDWRGRFFCPVCGLEFTSEKARGSHYVQACGKEGSS